MIINQDTCIGCGQCVQYCPVRAITMTDQSFALIAFDDCVECGVCLRNSDCPTDSIEQNDCPWPRSIRVNFSNPLAEHKETRIPGRGTEEMKTNDVTGRFKNGEVGIAFEVGRPGIGARLFEVEKLTVAMARLGIRLEPNNPLTHLIVDEDKGLLNPEVLNEKVLSAIVEFTVPINRTEEVLISAKEIASTMGTVFSVDLICKVEPDGSVPVVPFINNMGIPLSENGKNNLGLGKPLFMEEV
ncbi:MAG TPA: 4Fe-4S ferredoxin [Anaerolineaceae bacterium]|nr:4Fe-4S ferredoxin [Anaerolineaceae bacterium]